MTHSPHQTGRICRAYRAERCGKTTTLEMINRLEEPTNGTIYVNGQIRAK